MGKSILTTDNFVYCLNGGIAKLIVTPDDDTGDVVLFWRTIPFNPPATLPSFKKVPGVFPPNEIGEWDISGIPTGSHYQALAFPRTAIEEGALPSAADFPEAVGRVELPAITVEDRGNLLTTCAGATVPPQLRLDHSNNALRATLATGGHETRMLLMVGDDKPDLFAFPTGKVPRFVDRVPRALSIDTKIGRLHRVDAPANLDFRAIDELPPGEHYWFVAMVWKANGQWDFAWSKKGGVGTDPLRQTALQRHIDGEVALLTCVNDDTFEGEPVFYFQLRDPSDAVASGSYRWDKMETGQFVQPAGMDFHWSSEDGEKPETIVVKAGVDPQWYGGDDLEPFPVGDGANKSVRQFKITGIVGLPGGQPVFYADVKATVSYR